MRSITPLARIEFEALLDVQTDVQALKWAVKNSRKARKRECHIVLLMVDAASDRLPLGNPENPTEAERHAARMIRAGAADDNETLDTLVQDWADLPDTGRAEVLVALLASLIGHRLVSAE